MLDGGPPFDMPIISRFGLNELAAAQGVSAVEYLSNADSDDISALRPAQELKIGS